MTTNTSTNADQVLRRYLLGTLPPESLEGVEQRLFSDDRVFWERLSLVEEQLVDDYAWDRLEGEDRECFESRFLTTTERRAKLEFARALRTHVEGQKAAPNRVWQWLRRPVPAPGWAVAVAALFLLAVLPSVTWQFASTSSPQGIASVTLTQGQTRDIGQESADVTVGPATEAVRLDLETVGAEYATYSATVTLIGETDGQPIERWSGRVAAGKDKGKHVVTLILPADSLPYGDYYVTLQGTTPGSATEPLGRYYFGVRRND